MKRGTLGFGIAPFTTRAVTRTAARSLTTRLSPLAADEARVVSYAHVWGARRRPLAPVALMDPSAPMQAPTAAASPGTARLMDGRATAATVKAELAAECKVILERTGSSPGLAVVIVGERKDSQTYVRSKKKACEEVGIASFGFELPENCKQEDLVSLVDDLNARSDVHGILVQLPLPDSIDDEAVLDRIALAKDVDGFHPLNIGRLCRTGRTPPLFVPCTPKGCIELLDRYHVPIEGKSAVVIGRSNIVGLPVAMLLLHRNATVTICHSRTKDTEERVRGADIVVAACGRANFVQGEWLKEGAVVIDVGINAVDDATTKRGYRLVGDVDFASASRRASLLTPVPGGVGPMTIAMLLANTVDAAKVALGLTDSD
jgi:5,10-methylene-tetrahydrofolate dehydrogenase/methenyl tetrahydrofolate cyclohydrolase